MKNKILTDKEKLILGWEKRIKFHQQQLIKTRKFNRGIENGISKKIKLEQFQLKAIKKAK